MKLNRLFVLTAMGLCLFACSENELEGNIPENSQNEGTTYVGFSLKFKDANTRATENGTEAEQKINSVYVVMAKPNGKIEKVLNAEKTTTKGEGYYGSEKFLFKTSAGVHHFYAVVNPDQTEGKDNAPIVGGNIDDYFKTPIALKVAEIANVTGQDFMMASDEALVANVEDGVTEAEALAGQKNSLSIKVERVSAKITMTCDSETFTNANNNAGGKIENTQFTLKQGADNSYRMAQNPIQEIGNNTYGYTTSSTVYVKKTGDESIHQKAVPVYCLENIHTSYLQKNTTYLTLNTTFTPAKVVDCADIIKELKENSTTGTFYVVEQGDLAGNYIMKSDLDTYQNGKSSKLPAGVEKISKPYTDGKCYFGPIWIGQTDTDQDHGPVVRNTWYNLKITGITLPGEPEEPTIDPEEPLAPDTNVSITLTVMPWNFIDRGIELK